MGRGTKPEVVIDARRDRLLATDLTHASARLVDQGTGQSDRPELTLLDEIDAGADARGRAVLGRMLDNAPVIPRCVHQATALGQVVGQRLLDERRKLAATEPSSINDGLTLLKDRRRLR